MMAVLEQRILDGLGSIDEQATIKPILLQRDPLAAPVSADTELCDVTYTCKDCGRVVVAPDNQN